ncbi:MAG: PilN domain-containing protein [Burkholderiaceae bacterium]
MIRINLLPHREMRRQQRKKEFAIHLGVVAAFGAAIAFGVGMLINSQIQAQEARNKFIQDRIADLDAQIQEIANLESEIESLRARQEAVEQLQSNRTIPVHLLYDLVEAVPEGVYLTQLTQSGQTVSLIGRAQTTERIADLLRALGGGGTTLDKPQLGEIKAVVLRSGDPRNPEERRLFEFSINALIKSGKSNDKTDPAMPGQVASR